MPAQKAKKTQLTSGALIVGETKDMMVSHEKEKGTREKVNFLKISRDTEV